MPFYFLYVETLGQAPSTT